MPTLKQVQDLGRHLTTEASVAWQSTAVVAVSLAVPAAFYGSSEATFRYAGLALQLFGLVLVAVGIEGSLRTFKQASLLSRTSQWFVSLGVLLVTLVRRQPTRISGNGAILLSGTLTLTGHASAALISAPNALEDRVTAVEADLKNLRSALAEHSSKTGAELDRLKSDLSKSNVVLQETEARLQSLVKEEATGGLHLELVGLITLMFGTLFAGIPEEISHLSSYLLS